MLKAEPPNPVILLTPIVELLRPTPTTITPPGLGVPPSDHELMTQVVPLFVQAA